MRFHWLPGANGVEASSDERNSNQADAEWAVIAGQVTVVVECSQNCGDGERCS